MDTEVENTVVGFCSKCGHTAILQKIRLHIYEGYGASIHSESESRPEAGLWVAAKRCLVCGEIRQACTSARKELKAISIALEGFNRR